MIRVVPSIEYKRIKRISPSQLYFMRLCPYKMVLAEAFDKRPLLPFSPTAYLGTVLHKMLELIAKGQINTDEEFDREFDRTLATSEGELDKAGYGFFIPLHGNVKDFGMKKYQVRKHLDRGIRSNGDGRFSVSSEKWLASSDGTIGGKLDLIIESGNYVEIVDLKTGAITENSLDDEGEVAVSIKAEYQIQLKLYAQLYFENVSKYPDALSLIGLDKEKHSVSLDKSECIEIYQDAKHLLNETNTAVDKLEFVARPNEANCKNCLYRPSCSHYQPFLMTSSPVADVRGIIIKVSKFMNGNVSVWLNCSGVIFQVSAINQSYFAQLNHRLGKTISIYNTRKTGNEFSLKATKTTMIYE